MESQFATLRRIVHLHVLWLTAVLLGKELLSKEDLAELRKYGKLSLGDEISFIDKAFSLGRKSATLKDKEYKELTLEKLSSYGKKKFSSAERLAIREAKFHADAHIQAIAEEVIAASREAINEASSDLVGDVIRTLSDEVSVALEEKKTSKELANKLSSIFNNGFSKNWTRFATTELHRAKMRGVAMAIANKVDIYSKSDGIESFVSVVPDKNACSDCKSLYLDNNSNPIVFKLKDMMAKGTNQGVSHVRGETGLHKYWKPVLPPAHPHCFCSLVYVPPGMGWVNGKLQVTDSVKFTSRLSKAVDQGSMSPKITPPGPKSSQGPKIPKPPSMPGLPSPENQPGPGAGTTDSIKEGMVACPFGGDKGCIQHGGDGAKTHKVGGSIMQAHSEYQSNRGRTSVESTPEEIAAKILLAKEWKASDHQEKEVIQHLESGNIVHSEPLDKDKEGINKGASRVYIDGNGSAIMKPKLNSTINEVNNEVAGYRGFKFFGSNHCPPTASRVHSGTAASTQYWLEDYTPASHVYDRTTGNYNSGTLLNNLLEESSDPDTLLDDLSVITTMDIVFGNADRHYGNYMISEDKSRAKAIDHGYILDIGFSHYKNSIHKGFNSTRRRLKIPSALKTRMKNTTLSDLSKGLGKYAEDWQAGQAYLRMQYMLHTEEQEGYLPYDKFGPEKDAKGETIVQPNRKGAHEQFEDFAIDFIDKHSSDPKSPHYASAFQLKEMGVFMDPWRYYSDNNEFWRSEGEQFEYEKFIRIEKAANEARKRGEKDFTKEPLHTAYKEIDDKYESELKELTKRETAARKLKDIATAHYQKVSNMYYNSESLGDELDNLQKLKDEANKEVENAYSLHLEAASKLTSLESLINSNKELAKEKVYRKLVPPGQEKTFSRLNASINRVRSSASDRRANIKRLFEASKMKQKTAKDIENKKRNIDEEQTEEIDND